MNLNDYKNAVQLPKFPPKPKMKKEVVAISTIEEILAVDYAARAYADALEIWEKERIAYDEAELLYRKAESEVVMRFKKDALKECGLENHPKADKVFSMAWEHGHAGGYSDVLYWMSELSMLVLDGN